MPSFIQRTGTVRRAARRSATGSGGGHIKDALNIAGSPELSIWAGWLLDPTRTILLVLESDQEVEKVVPLFVRTGYTQFAGYLVLLVPAGRLPRADPRGVGG
ncbi:MAG: hypothetical protein Q8O42_12530 [Acidobacteriota bacterium]|nr:hypothetical protein [Acidobacteriota bacterium]